MKKSAGIPLLCLVVSACATFSQTENQAPVSAFQSSDPNHLTIAVVGINDFHGSLLPRERKLAGKNGELLIESGGAPVLASMLKILKEEMHERLLIIDAGDEWQGTLESNLVKGKSVVHFFNQIGLTVAAIGNHEFDFSVPVMEQRFREAKYPYVALNIFDRKKNVRPGWKNVLPSGIFEVEGIKIGVIGHSTVQTPSTTRYEYVKDLEFRDPVRIVNEESKKLRERGARAVLVTAHAGSVCERRKLNEWRLLSQEDEQGKCEDHEITRLAEGMEPGTLDGIIAGHTHQVMHHWLSGIPTIQDEAYNQHFNILYLTFDRRSGQLLNSLTRIEGLVPICSQTFQGLEHCDVRRLESGEAPKLVQATFHGKKVVPDPETLKWLEPIRKSTDRFRKEVVSTSVLPLTHYRDREGAFGNLVADAIREKGRADFSLVNSGGIRTSLDAGPITFDGIFRALPFDNILNVVRLKGKDVKLLFRIATSGSHGIAAFSGLRLKLIPYDQDAPRDDLSGDGKKESWETNRLLQIQTSDGKELKDDQEYTVATYDFLVNGGDDLIWFMSRIPPARISRKFSDYSRDIVTDYIRKKKVFNTTQEPLVNSENPRVVFEKAF